MGAGREDAPDLRIPGRAPRGNSKAEGGPERQERCLGEGSTAKCAAPATEARRDLKASGGREAELSAIGSASRFFRSAPFKEAP